MHLVKIVVIHNLSTSYLVHKLAIICFMFFNWGIE